MILAYLYAVMTPDIDKFVHDQLSVWPEAARNFRALKQTQTRQLPVGGLNVTLQYNPGRIGSSTAVFAAADPACPSWGFSPPAATAFSPAAELPALLTACEVSEEADPPHPASSSISMRSITAFRRRSPV